MTTKDFQTRSRLSLFASYYKPHLGLFLLDMVCALGIALVDLAFPYVSRLSMQSLLPEKAFAAFFAAQNSGKLTADGRLFRQNEGFCHQSITRTSLMTG